MKPKRRFHITDDKLKSMLSHLFHIIGINPAKEDSSEDSAKAEEGLNFIIHGASSTENENDDAQQSMPPYIPNDVSTYFADTSLCEQMSYNIANRLMKELREKEKGLDDIENGLLHKSLLVATDTYPFIQEYKDITYVWMWHADDQLDGKIRIDDPTGKGISVAREKLEALVKNEVADSDNEVMVLFENTPEDREKAFMLIASLLSKKINAGKDEGAGEDDEEYEEYEDEYGDEDEYDDEADADEE